MTDLVKTQVAVCTLADIGLEITGTDAPWLTELLNEYLSTFAKPIKRDGEPGILIGKLKCLKCDKPLDGAMGSFQWGMANGEGTCSGCGWPARAHHRPEDADGPIFDRTLETILQYHPDHVDE